LIIFGLDNNRSYSTFPVPPRSELWSSSTTNPSINLLSNSAISTSPLDILPPTISNILPTCRGANHNYDITINSFPEDHQLPAALKAIRGKPNLTQSSRQAWSETQRAHAQVGMKCDNILDLTQKVIHFNNPKIYFLLIIHPRFLTEIFLV